MVRDNGIDRQAGQQLVHQNHRHAIGQALFDDARRRRPGHHDNRANPVFEHARDQRTHVASCIRGIQQHALKAVREERRGKRREQLGMKGLMKIGANQPDDVGSGVDQTLRQPVDAIAEMIGSAQDTFADLVRNARARRERARNCRAGNARAFCDVCRRNE